jgi:outer membrane usher protein
MPFPESLGLLFSTAPAALIGTQPAAPPVSPEPAPPAPKRANNSFEISLPASLDDRYLGDITVRVDGDVISFDGARLEDLLSGDLTPAALQTLRDRIIDGRLTPASATTQDILVEYNSSLQEIRITTAVSARQRRIINFRVKPSDDKSDLSEPSKFSAFINAAAGYEYIWEDRAGGGSNGRQPITGTLEFGGRIGGEKGFAFISRHNYQEGRGRFLQRNETQFIYDRPDDLLRVTAGDLRYRGANFQTLPKMAGVTVERFFGLEPSRLFRPIGQTSFEIERPSTVDVRINGVVLRQLLLQGGRYDLRDFPLVQGANDVELVIRDDTGREQIISSRNFFDFNLLEEGLSDFSVTAGVRSRTSGKGIIYSDDYAISGFYRRGFSSSLTAGADVQFDRQGTTGGLSAVWASPIGVFRLEGAASKRTGIGSGFSADLGYSVTGRFGQNRWRWTGQINGQMQSRKFATLSDIVLPSVGELRPTAWSVNGNFQLSELKWNVSASGQYDKGRGGSPNRSSALVGATYSLSPQLSVGAFGRYANTGDRKEKGAFLQLTWRMSRNHSVRATYDTPRQEGLINYRYSPTTAVGSTQADFTVQRDTRNDDFKMSGSLFHTGNRFEATVQHDVFTTADLSSDRIQTTRASLATSIVFAGNKFAQARPIREGFAIVYPHKTLKDKIIKMDATENGARAESDGLGPAVVPDLSTFSRSSLYIEIVDLPPGYDLGSGQFSLKPPLYAGYKLMAGSGASVTMLGQVVRGAKSEPVALTGGTMEALDGSTAEPISVFTNRNGRLAGTGLRPGKYKLTLFTDPPYVTEVTIPDNGENLVNIGELRIAEP